MQNKRKVPMEDKGEITQNFLHRDFI